MLIRRAHPDDAEAIERIRVRGWQVAYRHVFPAAELDRLPVDASRFVEALRRPPAGHACFVAVEAPRAGAGVGTRGSPAHPSARGASSTSRAGSRPQAEQVLGWVTVRPDGEPGRGELRGLYVDPDAWGRGAGRALVARAEQELAVAFDEAVLWVLEANERARRFYEAAGWTADGVSGSFESLGVRVATLRYAKRL